MVHCSGRTLHWFCYRCARSLAEAQIGLSKHNLACMSTDGCGAEFSLDQRKLFLNDKLLIALDRIELETSLRMAGIENLETCPFCPFAAEYPPVEENKEFKCENLRVWNRELPALPTTDPHPDIVRGGGFGEWPLGPTRHRGGHVRSHDSAMQQV